jgi:hypothetical protein
MQKRKLKRFDAGYLLRNLELEPDLRARLEAFGHGVADLSIDDRDTLRDLVGERLMVVGFDAEDRPTQEGLRLEELIDLLFDGKDPGVDGER